TDAGPASRESVVISVTVSGNVPYAVFIFSWEISVLEFMFPATFQLLYYTIIMECLTEIIDSGTLWKVWLYIFRLQVSILIGEGENDDKRLEEEAVLETITHIIPDGDGPGDVHPELSARPADDRSDFDRPELDCDYDALRARCGDQCLARLPDTQDRRSLDDAAELSARHRCDGGGRLRPELLDAARSCLPARGERLSDMDHGALERRGEEPRPRHGARVLLVADRPRRRHGRDELPDRDIFRSSRVCDGRCVRREPSRLPRAAGQPAGRGGSGRRGG